MKVPKGLEKLCLSEVFTLASSGAPRGEDAGGDIASHELSKDVLEHGPL